jgi:transcriptional regulator with XRE-family HTH domain
MRRLTSFKLTILKKGLTQKEVAQRSGIDAAIISLISTGKYLPDKMQRRKIAKAVQMPEQALFGNSKKSK